MYAPGIRCGGRTTLNAYVFYAVSQQTWYIGPRAYGPALLAKKSSALTPEAAQGHWLVVDKSTSTDEYFRKQVYPTVKCDRAHAHCPCGFAPFPAGARASSTHFDCCKGACPPMRKDRTDDTRRPAYSSKMCSRDPSNMRLESCDVHSYSSCKPDYNPCPCDFEPYADRKVHNCCNGGGQGQCPPHREWATYDQICTLDPEDDQVSCKSGIVDMLMGSGNSL
jgi:hypothetical protein